MGLILDTSILINAEKGVLDLGKIFADAGDEPVLISAITASELLHGVERAKPLSVKVRRQQFVDWIIDTLGTAEFGLAEARVHAHLWSQLAAKGALIGPYDMVIAATALSLDFSLVTENSKEFKRVPKLKLYGLN
jgi:predicted nucleic acid-binding protein